MEDLLQVGIITSTHGVRGEVKVYPTTDDPRRFRRLKEVVLDTGREPGKRRLDRRRRIRRTESNTHHKPSRIRRALDEPRLHGRCG